MPPKMPSPARQKLVHFRLIAMILVVTAALFWGLAHI
jgi:hypothetical protein